MAGGVGLCVKCGAEKYRNASGKIYCKPCAARIIREWRVRNRDVVVAKQREKYQRTKEQHLAKCREYYLANREAQAVTVKRWQAANRDRVLEYKRRWSQKNRDRGTAYAEQRRALKARAICEHGAGCVPFKAYSLIAGQLCIYCGAPAEHADHYVPLARGGKHCRSNIVPACAHCNRAKGARLPDEWATRLREEVS
jgi:5-methylcytosine-specific restriction endonuclease McrA